MLSIFRLLFVLFACAVFQSFSLAQTIQPWDGMEVGTLPNGLTYVFKSIPNAERRVDVHLVVKVGIASQGADQRGFAHLTEHMLLARAQRLGLAPSSSRAFLHADASVSDLSTVYTSTYFSNHGEETNKTFNRFSGFLFDSSFDAIDLASEAKMIRHEFLNKFPGYLGQHNDVSDGNIFNAIFVNADYNFQREIDDSLNLDRVSLSELSAYHQVWYQPKNAAIVITGAVDMAFLRTALKKWFDKPALRDLPIPYSTRLIRQDSSILLPSVDSARTSDSARIYFPLTLPQDSPQALRRYQVLVATSLTLIKKRLESKAETSYLCLPGLFNTRKFGHSFVALACANQKLKGKASVVSIQNLMNEISSYRFTDADLSSLIQEPPDNSFLPVSYAHPREDTADVIAQVAFHVGDGFVRGNDDLRLPAGYFISTFEKLQKTIKADEVNSFIFNLFHADSKYFLVFHSPSVPTGDTLTKAQIEEVLQANADGSLSSSYIVDTPVLRTPITKTTVSIKQIAPHLTELAFKNNRKIYYWQSQQSDGLRVFVMRKFNPHVLSAIEKQAAFDVTTHTNLFHVSRTDSLASNRYFLEHLINPQYYVGADSSQLMYGSVDTELAPIAQLMVHNQMHGVRAYDSLYSSDLFSVSDQLEGWPLQMAIVHHRYWHGQYPNHQTALNPLHVRSFIDKHFTSLTEAQIIVVAGLPFKDFYKTNAQALHLLSTNAPAKKPLAPSPASTVPATTPGKPSPMEVPLTTLDVKFNFQPSAPLFAQLALARQMLADRFNFEQRFITAVSYASDVHLDVSCASSNQCTARFSFTAFSEQPNDPAIRTAIQGFIDNVKKNGLAEAEVQSAMKQFMDENMRNATLPTLPGFAEMLLHGNVPLASLLDVQSSLKSTSPQSMVAFVKQILSALN